MMKEKLNAAIIGCGRIASEFDADPKRKYIATHAGAYTFVKKTRLIAVCDVDNIKLKACVKRWNVPQGYQDYRKMLRQEKIDIISVCTPPQTHYAVVKGILKTKKPKAIFCEKPIADNLKDARKIVQLCKEKGVILQIDHQRRFDPLHQKLRQRIQTKQLGNMQQANFYYTAGIKNTGSHMFDLFRLFYGDVDWISAVFSKSPSHNQTDPNLDGMLKFKNGATATFQACDVKNYLIFELNAFFDKGRVVLKNSGFDLDSYVVGKSKNFSGYKELYKAKTPLKTNYQRNFMVNAVEHLVNCIENKRQSVSSGEDGLSALALIEAALKSARNNGKQICLN